MPVERPHLLFENAGRPRLFASKGAGGGGSDPRPVPDRAANAKRILQDLRAAVLEAQAAAEDEDLIDPEKLPLSVRATTPWGVAPTAPGRPEILSRIGFAKAARANLALAPRQMAHVSRAADRYTAYDPEAEDARKPQHFNFFESVPAIGVTTVEDLWASAAPVPAEGQEAAWEIWLKPERELRIRDLLARIGVRVREADVLDLQSARVLPVIAPRQAMDRLALSAAVAQLRPASGLTASLLNMPSAVQAAAVQAAAPRVTPANDGAPSVCLLDTGVHDHPLLAPSIRAKLVVGGTYTPHDYDGHGTKMAGLALFDNLPAVIRGGGAALAVALESVAIEPPPGLGGELSVPAARVRDAVREIETKRGSGGRVFCLAMNAPGDASDGVPSTLSIEIDQLAFNPSAVQAPRLFCVAAGNLPHAPHHAGYQVANEAHGIQTPAQAWNALTVGACTELEADLAPQSPLAPQGDLSPWSRTAVSWSSDARPPSKPDVMFEGGNHPFDPTTLDVGVHADLLMLTTSHDPAELLCLTGQTSAATAAAAGFCARIQAEYPRFWPETVRGLLVHAAEHTEAMRQRVAHVPAKDGRRKAALLQRFGYGRTDRARALENARNTLTLVHQGHLEPFRLSDDKKRCVLGQMSVHSLGWPIETLVDLGAEEAELRVTLSYFIEPNGGEALLGNFDRYASHNLDFVVQAPNESEDQMAARINKLVAAEKAKRGKSQWEFGSSHRGRGGLKHDRWKGRADRLAEMGAVAVFPRGGWWQQDLERAGDRVRYALIASIRTREEEVYAPIPISVVI